MEQTRNGSPMKKCAKLPMKFNSVSLFILSIATTMLTASIVQAQLPHQGQFHRRQGFPGTEQGQLNFQELNLSEEQKSKLKDIQEDTRSQIEDIFTNEQKNSLQRAVESGKKPPEAIQSINLSDDQKQELKEVMESEKQKISEILTAEQKEKLRDRVEQMQNKSIPEGLPI
jgi:periplasmic protein CpxP/Spy